MVSKYFEKLLEEEFPSCNLEKISEEEKRKAILKNLKMIIPCAGNGTRGYPAMVETSKELIPVPFKESLQNMVLVQIEKAIDSGILSENIAIVISKDKDDIVQSLTGDHSEIVASLRHKGKGFFADKVERVKIIAPQSKSNYILQNCPYYGNGSPLATKETQEFIGDSDFFYIYPDDVFATIGDNEIQQILETYFEYGGSILPAKNVEEESEFSKYGIVDGSIVKRPKNGIGNVVYKVDNIVEKPGVDNAPSNSASVKGYLFANTFLAHLNDYYRRFDGKDEFMIQIPMKTMMDNGFSFHAVAIDGIYCDTGNYEDFSLTVPIMRMFEKGGGNYISKLEEAINKAKEYRKNL